MLSVLSVLKKWGEIRREIEREMGWVWNEQLVPCCCPRLEKEIAEGTTAMEYSALNEFGCCGLPNKLLLDDNDELASTPNFFSSSPTASSNLRASTQHPISLSTSSTITRPYPSTIRLVPPPSNALCPRPPVPVLAGVPELLHLSVS